MDRKEDARSKKTIFVSSCLLNTNNKVQGLGRFPGMCKEVMDLCYKYDLGVNQMPCPETLYLGINRWWYTKELYDNRGFRDHCRRLAEETVTYMEEYERIGYETVAVLSSNGSPTCGVDVTSSDPEWGGRPYDVDVPKSIREGTGVYIEELEKAIEARGIKKPPFYGLSLDDESVSTEKILADFEEFIKGLCE